MALPVVVLTGGVASGKSAVSEQLARLGACIVDTDVVAHWVTQPGNPGFDAIVKQWGDEVLAQGPDQKRVLDRAKLRKLVFNDPAQRKTLEALLHPLIMAEVNRQLAQPTKEECSYAVVVIPLFAENPRLLEPQAVVVIDAPESAQIQRLISRDGIDEELAHQMLNAQASRAERRALATFVIENDDDLETLKKRAVALDGQLKRRFKGSG